MMKFLIAYTLFIWIGLFVCLYLGPDYPIPWLIHAVVGFSGTLYLYPHEKTGAAFWGFAMFLWAAKTFAEVFP